MVNRPVHLNAFEFVVISALRAQQLLAGCFVEKIPRARPRWQMEVASGCVSRSADDAAAPVPEDRDEG